MKRVTTSLNEKQFKRYLRHIERQGATPYGHTKKLILIDLGEEEAKAHVVRTSIIYVFTLYSLVISAVLLVF